MASDFIALIEPWLKDTDVFHLKTFHILHRSNCKNKRNSEGAIVFVKDKISKNEIAVTNLQYVHLNQHCLFILWQINTINIVMMYKSPKFPNKLVLEYLDQILNTLTKSMLIFGDINLDLKNDGTTFLNLMKNFQLTSKLDIQESSTNHGTHIDICFSNVENLEAWYYETYYSYHKPICIIIPK